MHAHYTKKEMHSRDTKVLIDLATVIQCRICTYTTPALFQYFFQSTMAPTFLIFLVYLFINFFCKHYYYD